MTDQELQNRIIYQVLKQRQQQDAMYGEHNRRTSVQMLSVLPVDSYSLPTEQHIKALTDEAMEAGKLTFAHVVAEELIEAVSATNKKNQREELIQLAASVIQWIEAIDRSKIKQS